MANPKPDLQGWADPEQEGWRERAVGMVSKSERSKSMRKINTRGARFDCFVDPAFIGLAKRAAAQRGMTLTSYGRRAIAAFIAHDLGMAFEDVVKHGPAVTTTSRDSSRIKDGRSTDDGTGYGDWTIS
jgi:hypothetical protein